MNTAYKIIGLGIAVALQACTSAQKASEVSSIRVPVAPYIKMNCRELATEMSSVSTQVGMARDQVDSAYSSEKTKEAVAWILFAPAALFYEGNQKQATKLASLKGQVEAIQEAQKINKCTL